MLKVHILAENRVVKRGLLAEQGLSLFIEKDDRAILFDTGQSSVYCHNAKAMGVDLKSADYIVLSHGHYDHCGGLQYFPFGDKAPSIYIHTDAFIRKYVSIGKNLSYREIGIPWKISEHRRIEEGIVYTRQALTIEKGIMILGEVPYSNDFEEVSGSFYIEKDGSMIRDMMLDEQMLIIEDDGEIAVFLGCSHRGVINGLNYARKLFSDKSIKLLVAGMHLGDVTPIRLQKTMQHLKDMNIRKVVPLHCTGFGAMCEMKRFLGENCQICSAGDTIEI